jgi:hypothetical protein
MPSHRETLLNRLFLELKTFETPSLKVYRNLEKPQRIPSGGLMILRDGTSGDPEILLSPLTYIYTHQVQLEIIIQQKEDSFRSLKIDEVLMSLGNLIAQNRTLDGLAEWIEPQAPEFIEESLEGGIPVRMALVTLLIRFATLDPLG